MTRSPSWRRRRRRHAAASAVVVAQAARRGGHARFSAEFVGISLTRKAPRLPLACPRLARSSDGQRAEPLLAQSSTLRRRPLRRFVLVASERARQDHRRCRVCLAGEAARAALQTIPPGQPLVAALTRRPAALPDAGGSGTAGSVLALWRMEPAQPNCSLGSAAELVAHEAHEAPMPVGVRLRVAHASTAGLSTVRPSWLSCAAAIVPDGRRYPRIRRAPAPTLRTRSGSADKSNRPAAPPRTSKGSTCSRSGSSAARAGVDVAARSKAGTGARRRRRRGPRVGLQWIRRIRWPMLRPKRRSERVPKPGHTYQV